MSLKEFFPRRNAQSTFYHKKNESKKYHIDYLYSKSLRVNTVEVGKYADWIQASDYFT